MLRAIVAQDPAGILLRRRRGGVPAPTWRRVVENGGDAPAVSVVPGADGKSGGKDGKIWFFIGII